jgi:YfiH family protein
MFQRGADGVWRSDLLGRLTWLEHGFGSRHAETWPGDYTRVRQIHSSKVIVADCTEPVSEQADALVTRTAGRWIGIRTADCVPVLLADPNTQSIAAIHAGWRGTVAGITLEAIRTMADRYGTRPADVVAAVGPAIDRCCFEVGSEVGQHFRELFPDVTDLSKIDLPEANRRQLISAGVHEGRIDVSRLCTRCDGTEFHSWRRDREAAGRMAAAVRILPK